MLATKPAPLPRMRTKKTQPKTPVKKAAKPKEEPKKKTPAKKQKPRVCVDLDGVLAKYDGFKGLDRIGPPLPGALEFAESLAKIADIVIFTSRCSMDLGTETSDSRVSPGQMRIRVIEWLEKHKVPYVDVYVGQGKPRVAAFIDDRAISCNPQKDMKAFGEALKSTRSLISRSRDR